MTSEKKNKVQKARTGKFSFIISPLDDLTFSAARFTVLMANIESMNRGDLENVEDLSSIDFFASHHYIIFHPGEKAYLEMQYHGFAETLEYSHPKPIYTNYLDKARSIIAMLVGKRCAEEKIDKIIKYILTPQGKLISTKLNDEYYVGYRYAVTEILKRVPVQISKWKELRESWLNITPKFAIA